MKKQPIKFSDYPLVVPNAKRMSKKMDKLVSLKENLFYITIDYLRNQYSKDGEYIIQIDIDDLDNIESDMSDEINKNYIIIGLSIFMLFVLVYIFSKNRKK